MDDHQTIPGAVWHLLKAPVVLLRSQLNGRIPFGPSHEGPEPRISAASPAVGSPLSRHGWAVHTHSWMGSACMLTPHPTSHSRHTQAQNTHTRTPRPLNHPQHQPLYYPLSHPRCLHAQNTHARTLHARLQLFHIQCSLNLLSALSPAQTCGPSLFVVPVAGTRSCGTLGVGLQILTSGPSFMPKCNGACDRRHRRPLHHHRLIVVIIITSTTPISSTTHLHNHRHHHHFDHHHHQHPPFLWFFFYPPFQ